MFRFYETKCFFPAHSSAYLFCVVDHNPMRLDRYTNVDQSHAVVGILVKCDTSETWPRRLFLC